MAVNDCSYTNSASTALNLNDKSDYFLASIRGIYEIEAEALFAEIPLKLPTGVFQAANWVRRGIELRVYIAGTSDSDAMTNAAALVAAFGVDTRNESQGVLDYTAWNGNRRLIQCALHGKLDFEYQNGVPHIATIPLLCLDPSFYGATAVVVNGAFTGTTPVNLSLANPGNIDAYPTVTYGGVVHQPQLTDARSNVALIENDMETGDALVLNFNPHALAITYTPAAGAATRWWQYLASAATLPVVKLGTNNMAFVGGDAGDDATISVSFYPRYMAHG